LEPKHDAQKEEIGWDVPRFAHQTQKPQGFKANHTSAQPSVDGSQPRPRIKSDWIDARELIEASG
jgi:hypothetical protein